MRHPLLEKANEGLRARVLALIKEGFTFPKSSNIIFVCGGNGPADMRPQFIEFCEKIDHPYLIFKPEYAISHALAESEDAFNLSEFEKLIGDLSLAIIIFPEAPGSFAEAGYFSGIEFLAKKSILLMDQNRVSQDSFLSIGPAKLISDKTKYHPTMHIDYANPNFSFVLERVQARLGAARKKGLGTAQYRDTSLVDKFFLIACIFDLLSRASFSDVNFIMKGLFNGRASPSEISKICAVMAGASLLKSVGDTDQYLAVALDRVGLNVRDGYREARNAVKTEISTLLMKSGYIGDPYEDVA